MLTETGPSMLTVMGQSMLTVIGQSMLTEYDDIELTSVNENVKSNDKAEMKIRLIESDNNPSASAEVMRENAKPVVSLSVAMGEVKIRLCESDNNPDTSAKGGRKKLPSMR